MSKDNSGPYRPNRRHVSITAFGILFAMLGTMMRTSDTLNLYGTVSMALGFALVTYGLAMLIVEAWRRGDEVHYWKHDDGWRR